jgi:hypothetical protein
MARVQSYFSVRRSGVAQILLLLLLQRRPLWIIIVRLVIVVHHFLELVPRVIEIRMTRQGRCLKFPYMWNVSKTNVAALEIGPYQDLLAVCVSCTLVLRACRCFIYVVVVVIRVDRVVIAAVGLGVPQGSFLVVSVVVVVCVLVGKAGESHHNVVGTTLLLPVRAGTPHRGIVVVLIIVVIVLTR